MIYWPVFIPCAVILALALVIILWNTVGKSLKDALKERSERSKYHKFVTEKYYNYSDARRVFYSNRDYISIPYEKIIFERCGKGINRKKLTMWVDPSFRVCEKAFKKAQKLTSQK